MCFLIWILEFFKKPILLKKCQPMGFPLLLSRSLSSWNALSRDRAETNSVC